MSVIIKKQLIMGELKIPKELIEIVKDYVFYDPVSFLSKTRKDAIIRLIEATPWSRKLNYSSTSWIFWIEEDEQCPQHQVTFCTSCGNYDHPSTNYPTGIGRVDRVLCNCVL